MAFTAGLKVHVGKCVFGADSIDFLGHRISTDKLEPQQDKLAAVRDLPSPTDISSLRAALGLFSYYRKFVSHFSSIAFPLNLRRIGRGSGGKRKRTHTWNSRSNSAMPLS